MCAENVTWRRKTVQCCTCCKWVHLRCSQLSLSKFRTIGSFHSWSCLPLPPASNTVTSSSVTSTVHLIVTLRLPPSDSSGLYPSTVLPGTPSTNAALPLHSRLQSSYPFLPSLSLLPLPPHHHLLLLAVLLRLLFPPPGSLRVLQWNAGRLRARSIKLLHFLLSHPVDIICIQESNLNSSSFFRIPGLSTLRSDCTHSRSGILSCDATNASGDVIIFFRQDLPFSKLSTSSLPLLDPYSDYVRINTSLNNSSSLSFLNLYAPSIHSPPTNDRTDSFSLSSPFSRNLFILGDFNCHRSFWDSNTSDTRKKKVFAWVISSDLIPLNDPDIPILLHHSSGSCSSPDLSVDPSSLALSCSWEVLQNLGSDHLLILLSVPLRSFAPTSVLLLSTFKTLTGMT